MSTVLLPSSVATTEPVDRVTCKLCRRQFSKYTCPTCNVPYCSLTCFRCEAHSHCSETFYKKEIESDIRSGPSNSGEDRHKMVELLKRFEEESTEGPLAALEPGSDGDDGDDEADLARRFQGVDLEFTSPDTLWSKLTPVERSRFMKAVGDPSSELAQQLLASEELEKERQEPWWNVSIVNDNDDTSTMARSYSKKPEAMHIPPGMVKPVPNGPPLFYNMCAICIAYSYTTRHLATSPLSSLTPDNADYREARSLVSQLAPFLVGRKSTMLFPTLSSLVTDIWSRFDPGVMNQELFALLLRDAAQLMRPLQVTPIASLPDRNDSPILDIDLTSHPHRNSVLVLSDLAKLYEHQAFPQDPKRDKSRPNYVTHKLQFYAAQILSTPSAVLRAVAEELSEKALVYQQEGRMAV